MKQRGLRAITLQGAIEKSPILLLIPTNSFHFGCTNNIFADSIKVQLKYVHLILN